MFIRHQPDDQCGAQNSLSAFEVNGVRLRQRQLVAEQCSASGVASVTHRVGTGQVEPKPSDFRGQQQHLDRLSAPSQDKKYA